jgi:hypothetical protein
VPFLVSHAARVSGLFPWGDEWAAELEVRDRGPLSLHRLAEQADVRFGNLELVVFEAPVVALCPVEAQSRRSSTACTGVLLCGLLAKS